jgi:hypothetical protein
MVDNLMFVQVDDIHQIDLFQTLHVVLQNPNDKDLNEAKMKKKTNKKMSLIEYTIYFLKGVFRRITI